LPAPHATAARDYVRLGALRCWTCGQGMGSTGSPSRGRAGGHVWHCVAGKCCCGASRCWRLVF